MSIWQFANSLGIIRRSEHSNRGAALARHIYWQVRKLLFPRPVELSLSRSRITDNEPGGVISLVNMLGRYDFNNMHFVQMVLAETPVFIDVGANIGAYTLIASENPQATVVALEPIPAAFAKLQRNIALNGRSRVHALPVAASSQPGLLRMTCDGASSVNHVVDGENSGEPTTLVDVSTIDIICRQLDIKPALIKIDVEGHEAKVLEGAAEHLPSCKALLIENGERAPIREIMARHGHSGPYYYRHRTGVLSSSPQPLAEDAIYIGPDFRAAFPSISIDPAAG